MTLLASPTRLALRGLGRPGAEAVAVLAGSTLNLGSAIALASRFGAVGVAAASLAGALLAAALLKRGARNQPGHPLAQPSGHLLAPILAGVAAFVAGASLHVWLAGASGPADTREAALLRLLPEATIVGSAFLLGSVLTGGIGRDDLEILGDIVPGRVGAALRSAGGGRP